MVRQIPSLTSVRAIAAWWVVCYHFREALPFSPGAVPMRLVAQGFLAVDLFFIVSGVVIALNYSNLFERASSSSLKAFFARRIARIYPLHFVVMLLFLLNPIALACCSASADIGVRYGASYYLASLLLIQNWGFFADLAWNIPAWSISAEFGAYLLFPWIALLVGLCCRTTISHAVTVLALCALLAGLFAASGYASLGDGITNLGLPRCIIEFTIGNVLGHMLLIDHKVVDRYRTLWLIAAVGLAGIAIVREWPDYIVAPACFALFVLHLSGTRSLFQIVLHSQAVLYLGRISYSTYLIHYFVKDWVKFVATTVGTREFSCYIVVVFVFSVALYTVVESPARKWLRSALSGF